jgi:metallo-beta-lactamase family protein
VLLTHAHIDHSGQLPKLMRAGFERSIYSTIETRELCEIMLADCGHIQESEVEHLNRRNVQRGRAAVAAIYTARDAARVMAQFTAVPYGDWAEVAPGMRARWWDAGHILGSASIELEISEDAGDRPRRLMFSGDLGPGHSEFLNDPDGPIGGVDHLILESTYGGRVREVTDSATRRAVLAKELRLAHSHGGPLLMPAFAVERTQELLADLLQIIAAGEAPPGAIFLDSPLAIRASEIFFEHGRKGDRNPFDKVHAAGHLHFLESPADSDRLEQVTGWYIIMAGSGMCDAGRIRKHLKHLLWRDEVSVLISGYQAVGTLGRLLQDGQRNVRIQGERIKVRAHIRSVDVYSGHADAPALAAWAKARAPIGGNRFLVHGEPDSLQALAQRISGEIGDARVVIPEIDDRFVLDAAGSSRQDTSPRLTQAAVATTDWHNAKSALLNDLEEALERAPDDQARAAIIAALAGRLKPRD